jgi:phenylacetate-coenzyme A ligase PaaK-like adenylate-forming protein
VPLHEARRIAEWIDAQQPEKVWLNCTVSNGVRVCEAAKANGLDVRGTRFSMSSEPLTEAKREEIRSAGGIPVSIYSSMDANHLAYPCPHADCADDMHVCDDLVAIVGRRRAHPVTEEPIDSFLITTLQDNQGLFLLNVEFDDFGVLETRDCGCYLDKLGFKRHIHHVRSFAKLTAQGTTVPWGDIVEVIERALPQRFGGASIDYQLVEQDRGRQTGLALLVSPRVGPLDAAAVAAAFLDMVLQAAPHLADAVRLWRASDALRVVRADPLLTPRGKLMPVRIRRSAARLDGTAGGKRASGAARGAQHPPERGD